MSVLFFVLVSLFSILLLACILALIFKGNAIMDWIESKKSKEKKRRKLTLYEIKVLASYIVSGLVIVACIVVFFVLLGKYNEFNTEKNSIDSRYPAPCFILCEPNESRIYTRSIYLEALLKSLSEDIYEYNRRYGEYTVMPDNSYIRWYDVYTKKSNTFIIKEKDLSIVEEKSNFTVITTSEEYQQYATDIIIYSKLNNRCSILCLVLWALALINIVLVTAFGKAVYENFF